MPQAERYQAMSGIGDYRGARIADQRDLGALLEFDHNLRRARQFVMGVITDQLFPDAIVLQQLLSLPSIFAGNQVGFLQHAQGAQGYILEVSDRCRHQVQATASGFDLGIRRHELPSVESLSRMPGHGAFRHGVRL